MCIAVVPGGIIDSKLSFLYLQPHILEKLEADDQKKRHSSQEGQPSAKPEGSGVGGTTRPPRKDSRGRLLHRHKSENSPPKKTSEQTSLPTTAIAAAAPPGDVKEKLAVTLQQPSRLLSEEKAESKPKENVSSTLEAVTEESKTEGSPDLLTMKECMDVSPRVVASQNVSDTSTSEGTIKTGEALNIDRTGQVLTIHNIAGPSDVSQLDCVTENTTVEKQENSSTTDSSQTLQTETPTTAE